MYANVGIKRQVGNCRSCNDDKPEQRPKRKVNSDWLSLRDVQTICAPCYEEMKRRGLDSIKKKFFRSLLEDLNMTLYEIVYTGEGTSYNFFGRTLKPNFPIFLERDDLPTTFSKIRKLDDISISSTKFEKKPTERDTFLIGAKRQGIEGIVWVGSSPKRVNDYGSFVRGEERFDLSPEVVAKLKVKPGFKVVE